MEQNITLYITFLFPMLGFHNLFSIGELPEKNILGEPLQIFLFFLIIIEKKTKTSNTQNITNQFRPHTAKLIQTTDIRTPN